MSDELRAPLEIAGAFPYRIRTVGTIAERASIEPRQQPLADAADLGFTPLARRFLAVQAVVASFGVLVAISLRLSIHGWSAEKWTLVEVSCLAALWIYFWRVPGRRGSVECRIAESVFLVMLVLTWAVVAALTQYPALAIGVRYADPWLERADATLGINVATLAAWTFHHPRTLNILAMAYGSFAPQIWVTILGLSVLAKDRDHLWEYVFGLHVFLVAMPICLALVPSICPQAYFGFTPPLDITHAVLQIRGFHDGRLSIVQIADMDGLVTFPSFHAANAMLVTWAWRRHTRLVVPIAALNLLLIASTFVTGVHYFVDVLGAFLICIVSTMLYRRIGAPFVGRIVIEPDRPVDTWAPPRSGRP